MLQCATVGLDVLDDTGAELSPPETQGKHPEPEVMPMGRSSEELVVVPGAPARGGGHGLSLGLLEFLWGRSCASRSACAVAAARLWTATSRFGGVLNPGKGEEHV